MENSAGNVAPSVHRVSGLFMFLLLAAFALFSLIAVMMGIQVYNRVVDSAETNSASRTSMSYVATKVRAGDEAGMVEFKRLSGLDVVVLGTLSDGERYNTYIYYTDGQLREYLAKADLDFDPKYGTAVAEVAAFTITLDGDMFWIRISDGAGAPREMHLYVTTGVNRGEVRS